MWTFLGIVAQHASAYRINSLANVRQRIGFYFLCAWGKKNITKQTFCLVTVSCVWGYCNFVPSRTNSFPGLFPSWNVRRNFIQMTRHYTNLGSASDWSCLEGNLPQQNQKSYSDLGSDASSVWNFCASHFILWWYQLCIRECWFVFSGCIAVHTLRGSNRKR